MKDKKLTKADVQFCALVSVGDKPIKECLLEAFPAYRKKSADAVRVQAERKVSDHRIVRKIAEMKEKLAVKVEDKYAGLKDEMVDRLVKGIRVGTDGDPLTIVEFVPAIKQLSTMLGWDAPKDINVRNGGFTADYKGPPTLMEMSDEEITAKLKELRGTK